MRALPLAAAVVVLAAAPGGTAPLAGVDCPPSLVGCVGAGTGGLDVEVVVGGAAGGAGRGPAVPSARPLVVVERTTAPTCTGNGPDSDLVVCAAALTSCPEGEVAVWTWTRTRRGGAPTGPWRRVLQPPSTCAGAGSAEAPTSAALAAAALRAFRRLPLPAPRVAVRPAGRTLVGLPTELDAQLRRVHRTTTTLLGVDVHVEARAATTRWSTGARGDRVRHVFRAPGRHALTAEVRWTATYRVGATGAPRPVLGTATTRSGVVLVTAVTAGARLT